MFQQFDSNRALGGHVGECVWLCWAGVSAQRWAVCLFGARGMRGLG